MMFSQRLVPRSFTTTLRRLAAQERCRTLSTFHVFPSREVSLRQQRQQRLVSTKGGTLPSIVRGNASQGQHVDSKSVLAKPETQQPPPPSKQFFSSQSSSSTTSKSKISDADRALVMERVKFPQTSVSLQALMSTGRGEFLHKTFAEDQVERHTATDLVLLQVASFLQRELPIRFAHRIRDLEAVPHLSEMESVQGVRDLYIQSGVEILTFDRELETAADEEAFAKLVESIYERHSNVLVQMARGAFALRKKFNLQSTDEGSGNNNNSTTKTKDQQDKFVLQNQIHAFLDRFYMSRIGIRVLIGQYLALRQPPVENYVGIICSKTSPYEIVKRAIDDAAFMCTRKYGDAPEVIMSGRLDLTFPYVPTHLRKLPKKTKTPVSQYVGSKTLVLTLQYSPVADRLHHVGITQKLHACHGGTPWY